jgi:hypothetical protein
MVRSKNKCLRFFSDEREPECVMFASFIESVRGPWLPYIYQYVVGGFFFFLAIGVAYYKGVFRFDRSADRRMIRMLVLGFVFYASLHGAWILLVEAYR